MMSLAGEWFKLESILLSKISQAQEVKYLLVYGS
jgi:hypothetical protein